MQFWGSLNIKDGKICDIVHEESMDDVIEEGLKEKEHIVWFFF